MIFNKSNLQTHRQTVGRDRFLPPVQTHLFALSESEQLIRDQVLSESTDWDVLCIYQVSMQAARCQQIEPRQTFKEIRDQGNLHHQCYSRAIHHFCSGPEQQFKFACFTLIIRMHRSTGCHMVIRAADKLTVISHPPQCWLQRHTPRHMLAWSWCHRQIPRTG